MSHIKKATALAVLCSALVAVPAGAQSSNTIVVKGGAVMKPGKMIVDNMRFTPMSREVKSGRTVRIDNRTRQPHTLSIVKKSDLPRNAKQMEAFYKGPIMGQFMQAHEVDPNNEDAPPGKLSASIARPPTAQDSAAMAAEVASAPEFRFLRPGQPAGPLRDGAGLVVLDDGVDEAPPDAGGLPVLRLVTTLPLEQVVDLRVGADASG